MRNMLNSQSQNSDRWQALDVIKTFGLLGALSAHIFIWWFGKHLGTTDATFYSFDATYLRILTVYLVVVHLLLVSAGAAFYFYLKKYKPTFKKIISRIALLVLLGVLFGLNLHPPALFWNVFLFYALSILIIFIINRYGSKKAIFSLTLCTLVLTPLLRLFLNKLTPGNYLSAILIGNQENIISFYPFFPWFFLIGSGFLISYFYSRCQNKSFSTYGLFVGIIVSFLAIPFFKPLDFSNIFGTTSQIPISYILFIFGSFIFLISLFELMLQKVTLSKYNPAIAIGRHILPIYLITVAITLPLTIAIKNSVKYGNSTYVFLILEAITFLVAYVSGAILTYRASKRASA